VCAVAMPVSLFAFSSCAVASDEALPAGWKFWLCAQPSLMSNVCMTDALGAGNACMTDALGAGNACMTDALGAGNANPQGNLSNAGSQEP